MIGVISETRLLARGREYEVFGAMSGFLPPQRRHMHCPLGTHPDRNPSFRWDDRTGRYHCTCSNGDLLDLVVALGYAPNLVEAARFIRRVLGFPSIGQQRQETPAERAARERRQAEMMRQADELRCRQEAKEAERSARTLAWIRGPLWEHLLNIEGTPAERYLLARLGECKPERWPDVLAFLESYEGLPAMVALFGIFAEFEPGRLKIEPQKIEAIHLTLLRPDGTDKADIKTNKKTIGRGVTAPIMLMPPGDGLSLAIGEGIEKTLAYGLDNRMGAWTPGAAGRLPALAEHIAQYIESVTLIIDDNPAGHTNSEALKQKLLTRDIEVRWVYGETVDEETA